MPIEGNDELLVNRSGTTYTLEQQNLMAEIQGDDLLLVNRSGATYTATGQELIDSVVPDLEIIVTFVPNIPYIDQVLTAVPNTSGGVEPEGGYVFTYQWTLSDNIDGLNEENLLGEVTNTYTPSEEQIGKFIGCRIQTTDARGTIAQGEGRTGPIDYKPATAPPTITSVVLTQDAVNAKRFADNSFTTTVTTTERSSELALEAEVVGALAIAAGTDLIDDNNYIGTISPSIPLGMRSEVNLGDGKFDVGDNVLTNAEYTPLTDQVQAYSPGVNYALNVSTQMDNSNREDAVSFPYNAFDGNESTFSIINCGLDPNLYSRYTFDFSHLGGIKVNDKVEVLSQTTLDAPGVGSNAYVRVQVSLNGEAQQQLGGGDASVRWFNVGKPASGRLDTFQIGCSYPGTNLSGGAIHAIKVDDVVLVNTNPKVTLSTSKDIELFQVGDAVGTNTVNIGEQPAPKNDWVHPGDGPQTRYLSGFFAESETYSGIFGQNYLYEFTGEPIYVTPEDEIYTKAMMHSDQPGCTIRIHFSNGEITNFSGLPFAKNSTLLTDPTKFGQSNNVSPGFPCYIVGVSATGFDTSNTNSGISGLWINGVKLVTTGNLAPKDITVESTDVISQTIDLDLATDDGNWSSIDNTQIWSENLSADTGINRGTGPNGFNGNLISTTSAEYGDAPERGHMIFDTSSYNFSGSVRVAARPEGSTFYCTVTGDTTEVITITQDSKLTPPVYVDNIQEIRFDNPGKSSANFSAIAINDKILVDEVNATNDWSSTVVNANEVTGGNSNYGPGYFGFDGDMNTAWQAKQNDGTSTWTYDGTDLAGSVRLNIQCRSNNATGTFKVNGSDQTLTNVDGEQHWHTVTGLTGPLQSIEIEWNTNDNEGIRLFGVEVATKLLVDTDVDRLAGRSNVTTLLPKRGEGTIKATNGALVTIEPFTDNCFNKGAYLIHETPKPIKVTPVSEVITDVNEAGNQLTTAGPDQLFNFAAGDTVTMVNADGSGASAFLETSEITDATTIEDKYTVVNVLGSGAGEWYGAYYKSGSDRFFAVGNGPQQAAYSDDGGKSWTASGDLPFSWAKTIGEAPNGNLIALNAGSNSPGVAYSTDDGVTWNNGGGFTDFNHRAIAYGGSYTVVVGGAVGMVSENNGANWSNQGQPLSSGRDIIFSNNRFVMAIGGTSVYYTTSTNPKEDQWVTAEGVLPDAGWNSVCYANGLWVYVAGGGNSDQRIAVSSSMTSDFTGIVSPKNSASWNKVIYANGNFLAFSTQGDVMYSPDGYNWSLGELPSIPGGWRGYAGSSSEVVLVGSGGQAGPGKAAYSVNGTGKSTIELTFTDDTNLKYFKAGTDLVTGPATGATAVTYTGSGSATSISGVGFAPDLVWIKSRNNDQVDHVWGDIIRGPNNSISSNLSESSNTVGGRISSFDGDGWSMGGNQAVNDAGGSYVAWCFDAGSTPAAQNSDGSINSFLKANTTTGFSVAQFSAKDNASVGHGLGISPAFIIYKNYSSNQSWRVYHQEIGVSETMYLDKQDGRSSDADRVTAVDSDKFTLGETIQNENYIAYCWNEVPGVSKFGGYTGSAGKLTIDCGFKPGVIIIKCSSEGGFNWLIIDNQRPNESDGVSQKLYPGTRSNTNGMQRGDETKLNFTDTGFEILDNSAESNSSVRTYVYAAWASSEAIAQVV